MKSTLLDMTQNILSALGSDEVNSIGDTTESLQVANTIKTVFFNIVARSDLPEQYGIFQLDSGVDNDRPVIMTRPANVDKIEWLKYLDVENNDYKYVNVISNDQFFDMNTGFNPTEIGVETMALTVAGRNYVSYYRNDRQPTYCTLLSDFLFIFDSYDASIDDTLQTSKTMGYGRLEPEFKLEDSFVPNLDANQFPLLLNEAKSLAFLELKQMNHPKAEQESKRQWSSLQKTKNVAQGSDFDSLPDFGRRAGLGRYPQSMFRSYGWRR